MAAFWLISGLLIATLSGAGSLLMGGSFLMALLIYAGAGALTMLLGLAAAALDVARQDREREQTYVIAAE